MTAIVANEGYGPSGFYAERASGVRIYDERGRAYYDLALAGGSAILGHAHPVVQEAVWRQARLGTVYTVPSRMAHQLADLMHDALPWFSHFVFCSSGSEANMRALRIARAVTGRRKVAMFSGGWHGAHDMLLVDEDYAAEGPTPSGKLMSQGTPAHFLDDIVLLPYNTPEAFTLLKEVGPELAAVIVEPVQGSNPQIGIGPFLHELRRVTRDLGALLIFDEVMTGFRVGPAGGQGRFDVQGDLATYGKVAGGGLPIGVVAGADVFARLLGPKPIYFGGTFSANPLTMAAGAAALGYVQEHRDELYGHMEALGARFQEQVNGLCAERGFPARLYGVGAMLRLMFSDKPLRSRKERDALEAAASVQARFYEGVLERGVFVGKNRLNFLSAAHTDADIDEIARVYREVLTAVFAIP